MVEKEVMVKAGLEEEGRIPSTAMFPSISSMNYFYFYFFLLWILFIYLFILFIIIILGGTYFVEYFKIMFQSVNTNSFSFCCCPACKKTCSVCVEERK